MKSPDALLMPLIALAVVCLSHARRRAIQSIRFSR
jgi:hypothetical protein